MQMYVCVIVAQIKNSCGQNNRDY